VKDALLDLIEASARLRAAGEPHFIATVVRVRGSSYRRPGARMIATAAGARVAGSISGGCLEGALLRTGWWRTAMYIWTPWRALKPVPRTRTHITPRRATRVRRSEPARRKATDR